MARVVERRKAIILRRKGKTYGEILQELDVAKSSLSEWLRDIPLTKEQAKRIKGIRKRAVERYRETMKLKREKRYQRYYDEQKTKWLPLTNREDFIAGLFLYWGEGNKASRHTVSVNNTDPAVVKFYLYWLRKSLNVHISKVKVQVHLYSDMDINKELKFWANELKIRRNQFMKPYVKKTKRTDIDQKGFGHGTCAVVVHNTILKENILMAIKAISDSFEEKIKGI